MHFPLARRYLVAAISSLILTAASAGARDDAPVVAAASDLQFAVAEIAEAFAAETGMRVRLSMGSTGNFARQIREGAPFQIFMAADEQFIFDLARDGFTRDEGDLYAIGRIVVTVPPNSTLAPDGSLESLRQALAEGRITRFAIANPDHAPYGMRAREALQHAGLWEDIQPFLVLGENVSQAAQFALS
ncbi:MAG: molybdate ABC transporter substrate-binding protein, partial [Rhodobacteraceae bacterium]|nr:molybdate ABC transporter substrate-binding protein [Paracoccaceae bacterium]